METDKYKKAIAEYEMARRDILALTDKISRAIGETDPEDGFYTANCRDTREGKDCITRSWDRNRKQHYAQIEKENCDPLGGDIEQLPPVELCPACHEVQSLVDLRKESKKRFGIAKRRLSQMGAALLREEDRC